MSNAACAKWILCSGDDDRSFSLEAGDPTSTLYQVNRVMDRWFSFKGIAKQLEGMYCPKHTAKTGDKPWRMNAFFSAYESGDMDKAWEILKQIQVEIR